MWSKTTQGMRRFRSRDGTRGRKGGDAAQESAVHFPGRISIGNEIRPIFKFGRSALARSCLRVPVIVRSSHLSLNSFQRSSLMPLLQATRKLILYWMDGGDVRLTLRRLIYSNAIYPLRFYMVSIFQYISSHLCIYALRMRRSLYWCVLVFVSLNIKD